MFSPLEMEKIEFEKKMGGYSRSSVDEVFALIKKDYEVLYKENIVYRDKVSMLEDLVGKYKAMEDSMNSALLLAQNTADTALQSANEKAEIILKEAKLKADVLERNSEESLKNSYDKANEIKRNIIAFASKNISLLKAQIDILNNMVEDNLTTDTSKE